MIKNESLGDRLNDFKNKEQTPTAAKNTLMKTLGALYLGSLAVFKTLVYGYGFKILFHTDWTFLGIICIGLGFDFLLTYIRNLIHNPEKLPTL